MAAINVGEQVIYHSEHGDYVGWVTNYDEGHEGGDYVVKGFTNEAGESAGAGSTFSLRAVVGEEQGAFTPHKHHLIGG